MTANPALNQTPLVSDPNPAGRPEPTTPFDLTPGRPQGRPADLSGGTLGSSAGVGSVIMVPLQMAPADAGISVNDMVARRVEAPDPLVSEVVRRSMPWRADQVAALGDQLGISESQLRRRCLAAVGIGPKALQRTLRFQGFLALAQAAGMRPPSPDDGGLAGLAARAGYADHAHLTRECVRPLGLAPRAFLGSSRCGCGHDHAASYLPFLRGGMHDSFKPAGAVAS